MALNPIAYTENVVRSFLRYQLTAYPFADPGLHRQMRELLSLDRTRRSPLLKGPYVSLSRPFRDGCAVESLVAERVLHPHLRERIPAAITHLRSHQEQAIRAIAAGRTTLISTGTGSGKTECFLYPIVSQCLKLRDQGAPPGISAVIVYPMNALAEDQLMRLRGLLAGTGIPFGIYVGKTPEGEADVAGVRLRPGASRADYEARLRRAQREGSGETVYPAEEVCSRQIMRAPGRQPRVLLTNVKQLELLLTRQQDIELFAAARLDFLVFDEAHTFTGALGAETACLIRRLRAFCATEPDHTTCVAASATIVDDREPAAARSFAARFFGVPAAAVRTVGEDYEAEVWAAPRVTPPAPRQDAAAVLDRCVQAVDEADDRPAAVRAAYAELAGDDLPPGDWPDALHAALSRNEIVFRLNEELGVPKALAELPPALARHLGRPVAEAEVLAWLTLGAAARANGRPLLRPVVHGFVRGIGGAVATFPEDGAGPQLWLAAEDQLAGREPGDGHAHFSVTTCTTCGQHYYLAFLEDFSYTGARPGGGRVGASGSWWPALEEAQGGKRVVLLDRLIGARDEDADEPPPRARTAPVDFSPLRALVADHAAALTGEVRRVFAQGWPEADAEVVAPDALRARVDAFADDLEQVVARLRRRLRWALDQIRRLDVRRERQGTLDAADEALFRRCDNLVKRLKGTGRRRSQAEGHDDFNTFNVLAAEGFLPGYGLEAGSVVGWAEIPFWRTGAMDFSLPRPPAAALREYVPGNLIYANGHRFVARRFHRDIDEERAELPCYEVAVDRKAVREAAPGGGSTLGGRVLQTMAVCDVDLIHTAHISDEEELRFQLGVAIHGLETGQHNGGTAYRWGAQPAQLRRGVRMRLVNVGASAAIAGGERIGYPVCTTCGQSISPLSSDQQRQRFDQDHQQRCGRAPRSIGFYADVVADALSLPACDSAVTAYSVLEALRIGAASVLDMHGEDLQVLVIGHVDREQVDGLLWDPMPGGSGLLERLCERFSEVVAAARAVAADCPAACKSSCIDCLQTFRNAYYHRDLDRAAACDRFDEWGARLARARHSAPAASRHRAGTRCRPTRRRAGCVICCAPRDSGKAFAANSFA